MAKNKALKKSLRDRCTKAAATHAVRILQARGLGCLVVGQLAGRFHGSSEIPTIATLAVLPGEGCPPPYTAYQVLVDTPGQIFARSKLESDRLVYYDPTASASDLPEGKSCDVQLTIMTGRVPGCRQREIQYINGLPVVSFLPLLVYSSEGAMEKHRRKCEALGRPPSMTVLGSIPSGYIEAMKGWNGKRVVPIHDEEFKTRARLVLDGLSGSKVQPFVELCRKQLLVVDEEAHTVPAPIAAPDANKQPPTVKIPIQQMQDGLREVNAPADKGHDKIILKVAQRVAGMLRGLEYRCAVLGGDMWYTDDVPVMSETIDIVILYPLDANPSNVRRALMTSLWCKHFHLKRDGEHEILYFMLKSIGKTLSILPRNMVVINISTPKTLDLPLLAEDHVVDLPIIPLTVLNTLKAKADMSTVQNQHDESAKASGHTASKTEEIPPFRDLISTFNSLGGHGRP